MKKLFVLFAVAAMSVATIGCGESTDGGGAGDGGESTTTEGGEAGGAADAGSGES